MSIALVWVVPFGYNVTPIISSSSPLKNENYNITLKFEYMLAEIVQIC